MKSTKTISGFLFLFFIATVSIFPQADSLKAQLPKENGYFLKFNDSVKKYFGSNSFFNDNTNKNLRRISVPKDSIKEYSPDFPFGSMFPFPGDNQNMYDSTFTKPSSQTAWEKAGQTKSDWAAQRRISNFGWGLTLGFRQIWYDNEMMNYFRGVSMFSIDLDILMRKWTITGNAAFGGGRLYDSLFIIDFQWQPQTKISTTTYGIFIGYAVKDAKTVKITPFAGIQLVKIKFKPQAYMVAPVDLYNTMKSTGSVCLGAHYEIKTVDYTRKGKFFSGVSLRVSYSYTILNFTDIKGFMHQVTIGFGGYWKKIPEK